MPDRTRVRIQRVNGAELPDPLDKRVLVDRVWPRGVHKESLALDSWACEVAPSDELRSWFDHDPKRWPEFQRRYREELSENRFELKKLAQLARGGRLVLLYGARDEEQNHAVVLRDVLEEAI